MFAQFWKFKKLYDTEMDIGSVKDQVARCGGRMSLLKTANFCQLELFWMESSSSFDPSNTIYIKTHLTCVAWVKPTFWASNVFSVFYVTTIFCPVHFNSETFLQFCILKNKRSKFEMFGLMHHFNRKEV